MLGNFVRKNRARPRLDYAECPPETAIERKRLLRKFVRVEGGIMLLRCGGGYRVLRRGVLPG
jgi:hypothetical protein